MAESRMQKTLLNARVNLVFYFLALILSFFSRKIFLDCLGADFIGLVGTLQNLLGFLNLAELGVGAAIGYVLYKPIFDHDQDKINEIISVMGYLYRWIGTIILVSGVILSLFLPLIFPIKDTGLNMLIVFLVYYTFLASTLIGYYINYRQNLLGADQRNYVVTACFQTTHIIKIIIQIVVAYFTHDPFYWVAIELFFGIIYSFILNWRINRTYPWLKTDCKQGKHFLSKYPQVISKTKQLFIHQINSFAQFQMTPFLTYAFVSLDAVACLGNYTLLLDKVTILMNSALGSTSAGVGNLIAEGNKCKIIETFWKITQIRCLAACIIFFGCYLIITPFILDWLGDRYLLPKIIPILLIVKLYIQIVTGAIGQFVYGYGLFSDVWSSVLQTLIYIGLALIGGRIVGLEGIISAGIISILIIGAFWKSYYLFSKGFKESTWSFWKQFLFVNTLNGILIFGGVYIVQELIGFRFSTNIGVLLIEGVGITLLFGLMAGALYGMCFKESKALGLMMLKRFIR